MKRVRFLGYDFDVLDHHEWIGLDADGVFSCVEKPERKSRGHMSARGRANNRRLPVCVIF